MKVLTWAVTITITARKAVKMCHIMLSGLNWLVSFSLLWHVVSPCPATVAEYWPPVHPAPGRSAVSEEKRRWSSGRKWWWWGSLRQPRWRLCVGISSAPCGNGCWRGRRWLGPGRHWRAQRWRACAWGNGKRPPPGHREKTSTTAPTGSKESSRWWRRLLWRCSFSEFASSLLECCSLSGGDELP